MKIISSDNLEQILDGLNLTYMSQYLRKFAPLGFFPDGHPIDYDSLKAFDPIQDFVSEYPGNKSTLLMNYGDFLKFGWTLFCLSIKNIENTVLCVNYAWLAYFSTSLGVVNHPEVVLQCKFLRLQIMSWIANDIPEMLREMKDNNETDISENDALSMLFMSDIYCTESVRCEEKWCIDIRRQCKEFEPDYVHMTKDEIINKGIEIHQALKIHLVQYFNKMEF